MRYVKTFGFLIIQIFVLGSCGPSKEEMAQIAEENAWAEMMKIHDEVMPKTSEIVSLYMLLKKSDPQQITDDELSKEIQDNVFALEAAEEAMFAWMNELKNLKVLRPQKSHEEITEYLKQETVKIESIKNQMLKVLDDGNAVLNKLSK